jgi:cobalamin biosynthetic protein CobC
MSDRTPPLPRHGGDLAFAARTYGRPAGAWLDLSTGINPHRYPAPSIPPETLHRLPDRAALAGLIEAARHAYRVPDGIDLVAVPGSEIAIRLLPSIAPPGPVAIVAPTYGVDAWPGATLVASAADVAPDAAVAVVVNPNNPDGRITPSSELPRRPLLIVDEAFADVAPEASIIPTMGAGAIVLRSLGKFYGLAGLRLGFVATGPALAQRIGDKLGDWPVSGPAIVIGTVALGDIAWRETMRSQLRREAAELRDLLAAHRLQPAGGTDLFVLVEHDDARALHQALAERGVWTRAFEDNPRWLRFGLPGVANIERLADALSAVR